MKKKILFNSLLVAGALTFTVVGDTAQADEQEGAKTVWGEVLPVEADPDGDGWANTGFDPTWMSQDAQDKISDMADAKDSGEITQVEFNEEVAALFQKEGATQSSGSNQRVSKDADSGSNSHPTNTKQKVDAMDIDVTKENLAKLALYSPKTLNAAPVQDQPYSYNFIYGAYEFHFSYDGTDWEWSYESVTEKLDPLTDEELIYLVHNDPVVLNERPVKDGAYDFKLSDDNYMYHFISDGENWKWSHKEK